jgi:CrcB protein
MKGVLWVGLGGFLGANARYLLGLWVASRYGTAVPWGTFIANITGSFALGLIMGLLDVHMLAPAARLSLGIGFIGAYTTFSTFTYETLRLIESGSLLLATVNVVGSVAVGLLAAIAGLAAGRAF